MGKFPDRARFLPREKLSCCPTNVGNRTEGVKRSPQNSLRDFCGDPINILPKIFCFAKTFWGALKISPTNLLLTQNLCGSPDIISPKKTLRLFLGVLLGRIWRAVALQQPPRLQRPPSRAVVPALGQETARTMRRFQARKRSKPHCGFAKKALSHPFPKKSLLRQIFFWEPYKGGAARPQERARGGRSHLIVALPV